MELPTRASLADAIHAGVPSSETIREVMQEVRAAMADLPAIQERLMSLSGEAWSPDGMVRVRVGPRGQLVDVEIDPRVFRRPDSTALRESILAANRAAVHTVVTAAQQLLADHFPLAEAGELRAQFAPEDHDPVAQIYGVDADSDPERGKP